MLILYKRVYPKFYQNGNSSNEELVVCKWIIY
jgi:hypothetical protein